MTAKTTLKDQIAVVTGASSGIGKAIALELAVEGARLGLVGRNLANLEATALEAKKTSSLVASYVTDLTVDAEIAHLKSRIQADFGNAVDILVHCAGVYVPGSLQTANIDDLDLQYRVNVRSPYLLTQTLLPMVLSQQGQIVFINSSVIRSAAKAGQYAATKHALRAIADSLRQEVNAQEVRVLNIYPGRTATPMQATIHAMEGKVYQSENLLQAQDVAIVVVNALNMPRTAEVTDISIRPFKKT